jgi:membrane protein required for colicin V production
MNWFDLLLILLLLTSAISGWASGFVKLAIGFAALILGFLAASWFHGLASGVLMDWGLNAWLAAPLGFFLIFAAVVASGALVAWILTRLLRLTGLSLLDRILGTCAGIARGLALAVVLVLVAGTFSPGRPPAALRQARSMPYLAEAAHYAAQLMPRSLRERFERTYPFLTSPPTNSPKRLPAQRL